MVNALVELMRCYNRYPDEKGTESTLGSSDQYCAETVTTVTPMKRGLKESKPQAGPLTVLVTTVTPMKRGLKDIANQRLNLRGIQLQPLPR